ncbi:MAG: GMC family oxidoreductase, partial [Pseudomonadota bacterium]|nr:GMC family oxidoreductase [Pseudomonadota bacterium]
GYAIEFAGSYLGIDDPDHLMAHADWLTRYMFRRSYRTTLGMGASIHECGGARMGTDPGKSVLNGYNQMWDASNLFVTDSSCFASNGTCGPTLTTMALTVRACEYIARELGRSI